MEFSIVRLNVALRQESEMVRETSQWEREEMEKVVSESENHLMFSEISENTEEARKLSFSLPV